MVGLVDICSLCYCFFVHLFIARYVIYATRDNMRLDDNEPQYCPSKGGKCGLCLNNEAALL